ncbi:sensor histidine kinase [Enterococcus termitis]
MCHTERNYRKNKKENLRLQAEKHFVSLTISDNGPGIPTDIREKIFEPFFTTKSADEGTGLGLFAVASIISKYEWYLDLHSELANGTTFLIILPVRPPE